MISYKLLPNVKDKSLQLVTSSQTIKNKNLFMISYKVVCLKMLKIHFWLIKS